MCMSPDISRSLESPVFTLLSESRCRRQSSGDISLSFLCCRTNTVFPGGLWHVTACRFLSAYDFILSYACLSFIVSFVCSVVICVCVIVFGSLILTLRLKRAGRCS